MFIKTVSTTSGINPIKFDETGGVFYWILNTGSSTIYASTKSAFTAGDDGVVSLGPKESRRLETNNDTIYILGEGQVEIHNQRDGICSFKQAPASSGGGGTIDAYSKTESDAKYAQKTDIPTSLPANGGDADTVDGFHADDFAKSTNPRINGDMIFQNDTNQNTISAIYSANDCLVFRNYTKDWSSICDVVIDNNGVRIANATQNFIVGNGGNADTVNSLRIGSLYMDIFSTSLTSTHPCWNKLCCVYGQSVDSSAENFVDNAPESGYDAVWYEVSTIGTGNRAYQIAHGCYNNQNKSFIRYMHDGVWSSWKNITEPIKSAHFAASTINGYIWTGIPFPKYVIGVDLGHFDVIAQFYKGNHVDAGRAEWTMMLFSKDDVTTPLNGSFNGVIYYID